jgi:hypothetical protein
VQALRQLLAQGGQFVEADVVVEPVVDVLWPPPLVVAEARAFRIACEIKNVLLQNQNASLNVIYKIIMQARDPMQTLLERYMNIAALTG